MIRVRHLYLVGIFLICLNIPLLVFSESIAGERDEGISVRSESEVANLATFASREGYVCSLSELIDRYDSAYEKFRQAKLRGEHPTAEAEEFKDSMIRIDEHLSTLSSEVGKKPLTEAEKAIIHEGLHKLIDRPFFGRDRTTQIEVVNILQEIPDRSFNDWIIENIFLPESDLPAIGFRAAEAVAKSKDPESLDRAIKVMLEHYLHHIKKRQDGVTTSEEIDSYIDNARSVLASLASYSVGTLLDESAGTHRRMERYVGYAEAEVLLGIFANGEMVNEIRRQWIANGDAHLKAILEAIRCAKHMGNEISDELFIHAYFVLELRDWESKMGSRGKPVLEKGISPTT
jgi:hypothetical protein